MSKPIIAFDESGNTGQDLLSIAQPIFVLASVNFDEDEAKSLCDSLKGNQAEEVHFTKLKKSRSGRSNVLKFLDKNIISPEKIIISVYHKKYMVVTKVVDLLIETTMRKSGFNLYKDRENVALANLIYNVMPVFCGNELFELFLSKFVRMIIKKNPEQISEFYDVTLEMKNNCTDEELKKLIDIVLWTRDIIWEIIDKKDKTSIDPAIPTFCEHCGFWSYRLGQEFKIIADESKALRYDEQKLRRMMKLKPKGRNFGTGQRKITFPYKTRGITFADSKLYPQIQLADVFAGATAFALSSFLEDKAVRGFKRELNETKLHELISNRVWPGLEVTPEEFKDDPFDGDELVDYVSKFVKN